MTHTKQGGAIIIPTVNLIIFDQMKNIILVVEEGVEFYHSDR